MIGFIGLITAQQCRTIEVLEALVALYEQNLIDCAETIDQLAALLQESNPKYEAVTRQARVYANSLRKKT